MKTRRNQSKRPAGKSSRLKNALEILLVIAVILLVIAVILLIPLFFAIRSQAGQTANSNAQPASATGTPTVAIIATPAISTPIALPPTIAASTGKEPPACTFPLAQTTIAESASVNYTFSEPKLAPVNKSWSGIVIYQWLPDNQRVLIGHGDPDQNLTLFKPQTGETQDFGSRPNPSSARPPVWVAGLNAVVYPETRSLTPATFDNKGRSIIPPTSDYRRQLLISLGDPAHAQSIEDGQVTITNSQQSGRPSRVGSDFTVAVNSDGNQIVYMDNTGTQLQERRIVHGLLGIMPSPSFDASKWTYRTPAIVPANFHLAWRPNSTQIFLYNDITSGGYTFLLDVQSGQVCELNLFGKGDPNDWRKSWAPTAHWSPNGRYLAAIRTKGPPFIDFSDLIILDTATGKLYQIDPTKLGPAGLETQGKHYVSDVAWAPDNLHLAVIGQIDYYPSGGNSLQIEDRLFLLDFLAGKVLQISSAELGPNLDFTNKLLWSNDGSQLIVECSPGGLCLLSVQKQVQ